MPTEVRLEGLAPLQRWAEDGPRRMQRAINQAITDSGKGVRDESRRLVGRFSDRLGNSIQARAETSGLGIGSLAKTAYSIETGRVPGPMPSVRLIQAWIHRKGLASAVSLTTHRRISGHDQLEHEMAGAIATNIQRHGTKPLPFIRPALANRKDQIIERFRLAIRAGLQF